MLTNYPHLTLWNHLLAQQYCTCMAIVMVVNSELLKTDIFFVALLFVTSSFKILVNNIMIYSGCERNIYRFISSKTRCCTKVIVWNYEWLWQFYNCINAKLHVFRAKSQTAMGGQGQALVISICIAIFCDYLLLKLIPFTAILEQLIVVWRGFVIVFFLQANITISCLLRYRSFICASFFLQIDPIWFDDGACFILVVGISAMDARANSNCGCEGPESMYVKLISSDGHEFIVKREMALMSGTIRAMLSGPGTLPL